MPVVTAQGRVDVSRGSLFKRTGCCIGWRGACRYSVNFMGSASRESELGVSTVWPSHSLRMKEYSVRVDGHSFHASRNPLSGVLCSMSTPKPHEIKQSLLRVWGRIPMTLVVCVRTFRPDPRREPKTVTQRSPAP